MVALIPNLSDEDISATRIPWNACSVKVALEEYQQNCRELEGRCIPGVFDLDESHMFLDWMFCRECDGYPSPRH
jgi:hypothetical protein